MWRQEVERVWAGLSEEVILEVTRWRSEHPRATFKEVEEAVDGSLSRVRARLLQEVVLASDAREVRGDTEGDGAKCPECGHLLQDRGKFIRRVSTNFGQPIELKPGYGVCPACKAGSFPPG